jgi:hypothetical protein
MKTPLLFLAMSVLKSINHEFKYNVQNTFSYKLDVGFDKVLPQQPIGKQLSIRLVNNPIYFIDKVFFKKTGTIWKNNMAYVSFDVDIILIDDPWFLPPCEEYPIGYLECTVDKDILKSKPLILQNFKPKILKPDIFSIE